VTIVILVVTNCEEFEERKHVGLHEFKGLGRSGFCLNALEESEDQLQTLLTVAAVDLGANRAVVDHVD
jgi:hypothetical protein